MKDLFQKWLFFLNLKKMSVKFKFLLFLYLSVTISIVIIGFFGYISASNAYREKAIWLVSEKARDVRHDTEKMLYQVPVDLDFVTNYYALTRYLYWMDLGEEEKAHQWNVTAVNNYLAFLDSKGYYYTLRFLDLEGKEIIKIRYDRHNEKVTHLTGKNLQIQKDMEYFQKPLKMQKNEIYISPLTLNQEHGKIEKPIIPVVRFATPVVGANNTTYGIMVINVYAEEFLKYLAREYDGTASKMKFYFISAEGDYFHHPDREKSWGHLFGKRDNFKTDFPEIYKVIQEKKEGYFIHNGKLINFLPVHPSMNKGEDVWYLISELDESEVLAELNQFLMIFALIFISVILTVFFLARYAIEKQFRPLFQVTKQLELISLGDIRIETFDYHGNDEISSLLLSANQLATNLDSLTKQVNVLASGDYSSSLTPLSDKDKFSKAINNMAITLAGNRSTAKDQNWLKDGLSNLSRSVSGDLSTSKLASVAISTIAHYLEAAHGVIYLYAEGEDRPLSLMGSYMFTERDHLSAGYKMGEGSIGQVALERKPILIKNITKEEQVIITGTVAVAPLLSYSFPLMIDEDLVGVSELAMTNSLTPLHLTYLSHAADIIAQAISGAQQKEQIRTLLLESQEATKQAEEKSRELEEFNAKMELQQQKLQQQAEELQQTNAQMEEQKQQLEQQTEELQQTNAQMEEQQQQLLQQTEELKINYDSLTVSKQELDEKAELLEQANKYKSEFLANMSHELRTPLNSIILLSKMMKMNERKNLQEDDVKQASVIHQEGNNLLNLINDILDLSKIEAGKMDLYIETINSKDFLDNLSHSFKHIAEEKGLNYIIEDHWQGSFVSDSQKLGQVLKNLLSNAIKFTKEGYVSIHLDKGDNPKLPLRFIVEDTGIGISVEHQEMIFNAFQQVDGTISREFGGTGLGLSIAKSFVVILGGTISLESNHGEGSRFVIELPENCQKQGQDTKPLQSIPKNILPVNIPEYPPAVEGEHKKILLVEDDLNFQDVLIQINQKLGYITLVASTGQEALQALEENKFDGVLLDLGLPDMNGSKILDFIKGNTKYRNLPVYILSSSDFDQTLIDHGALGFMQKPVNEEDITKIEALLVSQKEKVKQVLVVGGKDFDLNNIMENLKLKEISHNKVKTIKTALNQLKQDSYQVLILDTHCLGKDPTNQLGKIQELDSDMPIIIVSSQPLDLETETIFSKYAESIIIQAQNSDRRILLEVERFLGSIQKKPKTLGKDMITDFGEGGEGLLGKRILAVDDDARNLFVITAALERQGAIVETALNGFKAIEALKAQEFDLVFMDIMMPDLNGFDAIEKIRKELKLTELPIIALTAKALKEDRQKSKEVGANDYLSKPVEYDVLVNMAQIWTSKK